MRRTLAILLVLAACKEREPARSAPIVVAPQDAGALTARAIGRPAAPGTLRTADALTSFAVLLPQGSDVPAVAAAARRALTTAGLTVVDGDPTRHPGTAVALVRGSIADGGWTPALAQIMRTPADQAPAIEHGAGALRLVAHTDVGHAAEVTRALGRVAGALAAAHRGWLLDVGAGELRPLDDLDQALPHPGALDVRKLIVIHAVAGDGALLGLDTFGLRRYGLPELALRDVPPALAKAAATLLNATAQRLLAGGDVAADGSLMIDVASLGPGWHGDVMRQAGGTATITWQTRWYAGDHDPVAIDPADLWLELHLADSQPGSAEALMTAVDRAFGKAADKPVTHGHDPRLDAAAERARRELRALRPRYARGVPPGERLAVKAPFATDHGATEWMWVDVVGWKGDDALDGILNNDPSDVSTLVAGARVEVKLDELGDYVQTRADGTTVGGYSIAILRGEPR
jgi:uncharacterized protein YegJ (DUF2314 family)